MRYNQDYYMHVTVSIPPQSESPEKIPIMRATCVIWHHIHKFVGLSSFLGGVGQ